MYAQQRSERGGVTEEETGISVERRRFKMVGDVQRVVRAANVAPTWAQKSTSRRIID